VKFDVCLYYCSYIKKKKKTCVICVPEIVVIRLARIRFINFAGRSEIAYVIVTFNYPLWPTGDNMRCLV
jgi:hypothetical protein